MIFLAIAVAGLGLVAGGSAGAQTKPRAVCPTGGIGDRFHPRVGIPGVKVRSTETHLTIARGLRSYVAETRLNLTATESLRCAALDYSHGQVLGASVDGRAATSTRRVGKVIVDLGRPVATGTRFDVVVRTHTMVPHPKTQAQAYEHFPPGLFDYRGVMSEIGQPSDDHDLVPMADHPAQKAPWHVIVDVPRGMTLAFTGHTTSVQRLADGGRRFVADSDGPIAPDILQLAVGRLQLVRGPTVDGVHLRSYLPPADVAGSRRVLALLPGEIRTMTGLLGRFPFPQYGVLATPYGGDLEDQTLTTTSVRELKSLQYTTSTLFHELVHEWFGDSVSPARWSDLWLAEGHAEYYEYVYGHPYDMAAHKQYKRVGRRFWEGVYKLAGTAVRRDGPIAAPRVSAFAGRYSQLAPYGPGAYKGGAVALYALRARLGQARFDRIERDFVHRYRNAAASTRDYQRIVERVAGRRTRTWFGHWLYRTNLPPLPSD